MKVGKEAIIGLMTALELYAKRDFKAEQRHWRSLAEKLVDGLVILSTQSLLFPSPTGQPYPTVQITIAPARRTNCASTCPESFLRRMNRMLVALSFTRCA